MLRIYYKQMPFFPKKSFKGRKGTKARGTKRSAPTPSKALTQAVTTVIKRKQETKFVSDALFNNSASPTTLQTFVGFNGQIASTSEMYACIPRLTQGAGDHQRIGNQIQPTSLTVKGLVSLQSRSAESAHAVVDIYFLTSKQVKTELLYASTLITKLLNNGDGTNTDYDGTTYHAEKPINTSEFTLLKHKRIILDKSSDSPNSYADLTGAASSVIKSYSKHFNVKIPMPKSLTYQTDANTTPASYYPFMVIGWNFGDNNGGSFPALPGMVNLQAQSFMYYKDA